MDSIPNSRQKAAELASSVAEAEAAYEKSLGIVPRTRRTALNTTDGIGKDESEAG